ncbi:Uncharacterized protein SCF082_LOCUS29971 [Durusdinium trenchii]|uniref:Uncharacterized protein n=1 Tax=Durusdinium trenchii TaxID=1381693 RepID=A0ABP0LML9_9DINO
MALVLVRGADGSEAGAQQQEKVPGEWDAFKMPFGVATLESFQLRAYLNKVQEGEAQKVEWLWGRVHDYCKVQQQPGRMLALNLESIKAELKALLVPETEVHYRGQLILQNPDAEWKCHTLESRGLLVMTIWLMKNRGLKALSKNKALNLLLGLANQCLDLVKSCTGVVVDRRGGLKQMELPFEENGICRAAFESLVEQCPGAKDLWQKLMRTRWMGHCIITPIDAASLGDVLYFLTWAYCHPRMSRIRGCNLHHDLVLQTLPRLINTCGRCLDLVAANLANQELRALPALQGKNGQARRQADPVNKVILLYRLRNERLNRRRVAATHEELGSASSSLIKYESYVDCLLHSQALRQDFEQIWQDAPEKKQVQISWDPSSYGGKEVLVSTLYSPWAEKGAFLMNQQLTHVMLSEVSEELLPLARQSKLKRIEGFKELRGVSAALNGVGLSLMDFAVPEGLVLRPLKKGEYRIPAEKEGYFLIFDSATNSLVPEIPDGISLGRVPALVSVSDQGPINLSALNFLQYSQEALLISVQFDPFHRGWNDLKNALKRAECKAWKVVLQLTLVANLPYGPFGTSAWYYKKRAKVEEFLGTRDIHAECWQTYQHLIALEKRIQEPRTEEDQWKLFHSLRTMPSVVEKGPLIKLMRWFSFFESMCFMEGQFWCTKMILEEKVGGQPDNEDESGGEEKAERQNDPAKELQELKKRKGTWKLAPSLITDRTLAIKDCIMSIGKAVWKTHAGRAREVKTPLQVQQLHISCAQHRFWAAELEDLVTASLWDTRTLDHLLPEYRGHADVMEYHTDMFHKVLETRAQSLVAFHELPPCCFFHSLAKNEAVSVEACSQAINLWNVLLEVEAAHLQGADIKPLQLLHWRRSPLTRCILMAFEQDRLLGWEGTAHSQSKPLQTLLSKHLGDSRVIEVAHQSAKDVIRSSKANTFTNTAIMQQVLNSTALSSRKIDQVKVSPGSKVQAESQRHKQETVSKMMKASTHTLPKKIQDLMQPTQSWPSPSPAGLFQSAAATQWIRHFWNQSAPAAEDINRAWLSVLTLPGSTIANSVTSTVLKVVATAEYGFLAWAMSLKVLENGDRVFVLMPDRKHLQWHHITDLESWVYLPCKPTLINDIQGPLGWKVEGAPMPLEQAVVMKGMPITVQQMMDLVKYMGGSLPSKSKPSRKAMEELLMKSVFQPENVHAAQEEFSRMKNKKVEETKYEIDSDFSELLSELGQDDANTQDLKDLKSKRRQQRVARKMKKDDVPLKEDKPKRGRGRGRGKGRGRGRSAGKGKPEEEETNPPQKKRKNFVEKLLEAARKKLRTHDGETKHTGQEEVSDKKEPAPPGTSVFDEPERNPGGASSSSKAPPPAPAKTEGGVPAPRTPSVKVYKSPEDILSHIAPPGCTFGLSHYDHRFTSRFAVESEKFLPPFHTKTMTAAFFRMRTWQDALRTVHEHNWKKWGLVKEENPLPPGKVEQVPGDVPQWVFEALQPAIDKLPEVRRYTK